MNAGTRTGPFTVWLASYPKSGNTWTRAVLQSLTPPDVPLGAGAAEASCVDINALVGTPMAGCRATIDAYLGFAASDLLPGEIDALRPAVDAAVDAGLDRILFRKAHDALFSGPDGAPIVSATATRAAIYLVRDPRDVAVSFARFEARSPSAVVASMADPGRALSGTDRRLSNHARQRLGTWSQHVESWTCHDLFPVAVFRYEDLHADPVGEFGRMAAFAGLTASRDEVAAAVAAARFDRLQAQEARYGFRERVHPTAAFFRRGIVGSWRDELPADLVRRIETDHGATMLRLGYRLASDGASPAG